MAALTGAASGLAELLEAAELPATAQVIGPVRAGSAGERVLIRVARRDGAALAVALKAAAALRSARKAADVVKLVLDPPDLL
jgi:primosomal protein N' (replication factor Y)